MERRNTIQKEYVLDAIRSMKGHVNADEVYEYIHQSSPSISRGTVYRNLNILSEEGKVKKIRMPEGADIFDFALHEHYHVRCLKCKKVFDVDMDVLPNLTKQIKDLHGFKISGYQIVFEGICPDCLNEN